MDSEGLSGFKGFDSQSWFDSSLAGSIPALSTKLPERVKPLATRGDLVVSEQPLKVTPELNDFGSKRRAAKVYEPFTLRKFD